MAEDPRTLGKPEYNDGSLPKMEYDYNELPLISENIWHAQMAGWPRILTYDHVADAQVRRQNRSYKRNESIVRAGVVRARRSSADEYPFASTVENAGSVFIGHAPQEEQNKQGGLISAFYAKHNAVGVSATKPFWFGVVVINYPTEKQEAALARGRGA